MKLHGAVEGERLVRMGRIAARRADMSRVEMGTA